MNNIPKLKFRYLSLDETKEIITWTLNDKDNILNIKEGTLFLYPELKNIKEEDNIKEIIKDRYNNFIKESYNYLKGNEEEFRKKVERKSIQKNQNT